MKIGGDVVTMQEFSSLTTCLDAAHTIQEKLPTAETECIKK